MARVPSVRIHFSDGTSMDLPENDSVQVVTAGPESAPKEGWQKLSGDATPVLYGKLNKTRAAALTQGQHMVTFRGLLLIDGARRI